jgi:hypothetical protein
MTSEPKLLFVSYAQQDAETVSRFVEHLNYTLRERRTPVDIWMDRQRLAPEPFGQKQSRRQSRIPLGCWSLSRLRRSGPRGSRQKSRQLSTTSD